MVLTGKVVHEFGIQSPSDKFFKVYTTQLHSVQNVAQRVHETKVHEGDWHDIGSVKIWTITIDGKVETCKENIEVIDEQSKLITFNVFDGEVSKKYKTFKFTLQVIDVENAGGVLKLTLEYEKLSEDITPPYGYLDFVTEAAKDVDAHLLKA
uniref:Bet v I/Major latex protein domain-containing protein n=2 Tax=Lotus japonicus TaxID=34305 RepID=I3SXU3_LOTJA|nr:unknown [Lotus japonicus]